MITKVDNVIIGNEAITGAWDSASKGQIILADENFKRFKSSEAKALYIGVCTGTTEVMAKDGSVNEIPVIRWSDRIQKESKPRFSVAEFAEPEAAKIEINLSGAEIVKGHRYVLRVLYKDIEVANMQFTHTYEVIATSEVVDDLGNAFLKKINAHANRRVNAAYAGSKLTLTAKAKNYDDSIDALDEYSIVSMDASLYVTIPGALLSNQPEAVIGAVITKTEGNPGSGYWKQVRDMERRAMGYRGHVFTGAYPSIEQEMLTEKGGEYNTIIIENDNLYLSPDNQYIKTTPVRTIICAKGAIVDVVEALHDFGMLNTDNLSEDIPG